MTKRTSQEVEERLANATVAKDRIDAACDEFRPVATQGSVIYFAIMEMRLVDHMYQTALPQFMELWSMSIDQSEKSRVPTDRVSAIIKELVHKTSLYICRGLFERHRLVYLLLVAIQIQMTAGVLNGDHFSCLLKGGAALDINEVLPAACIWRACHVCTPCVACALNPCCMCGACTLHACFVLRACCMSFVCRLHM